MGPIAVSTWAYEHGILDTGSRWVPFGTAHSSIEWAGKNYVIVFKYFSKFIENSVIPDKTTFPIIKFIKIIFTRYGIPLDLVADNNPWG